ncbi:VOC family protein [Enterovibrio coralii]|uniref:Glyoxalase n=1 Tax=Enterovibrio coralii TaxID=294935 RepID=A0A135I5P1_9GAMM|nr:VOC family protein [Enterovibrio coralii]KXF80775.1 glyoxalase [Enterovibrio coralii]
MNISHLDHFVLTVADIDATVNFYESVMGMKKLVFGEGRVALSFGQQKINLHQHHNEFKPHAMHVQPGSADLCFIADSSIEEIERQLLEKGVEIEEGLVSRTGAQGPIVSLYFRDPDGNLIEVSNYLS